MTDHYDEMRVPPDPVLAEELRQRLHAHMAQRLGCPGRFTPKVSSSFQ